MKPWRYLSILVAAFSFSGASGTAAAQPSEPAPSTTPAEITVAQLIGAMPSSCESVMVRRIDELLAKDSTQREMLDLELKMYALAAKATGAPPEKAPKDEIEEMSADLPKAEAWDKILAMCLEHKPVLHCVAGSGFEKPPDLGVGPFNEREVWVFKEPIGNDPYAAAEKLDDVTVHSDAPVRILSMQKVDPVYGGKERTGTVYIAFFKDRTLIRAKSAEDVAAIVKSLTAPPAAAAARWGKLADAETLSSSMFVLRAFDPGADERNWQLKQPLDPAAEHPHLLRLVLPKAKDTAAVVTCITTARPEARLMTRYYGIDQALLKDTDDGVASVKPPEAAPDRPHQPPLADPRFMMIQMQAAMGIYVAI